MAEMNYKVGKGYRLVRVGEKVQEGDEFWDWCQWLPVDSWGMVRERKFWKVVRRKVD